MLLNLKKVACKSLTPTNLWHKRYDHLNHKGLHTLQSKNMVEGLPKFAASTEILEPPFQNRAFGEQSQPLELIYYDICGPITPTSNSGKRYFISFIDDFSRKAWVYLLAEKSEDFSSFKSYLNGSVNLGKQTRLPFVSSPSTTSSPFELLHCDLWTSPIESISGLKYFLVIIDDFSHYIWTFPLRFKSDTTSTIQNFFLLVQTQFSSTIKQLQCDHGGEPDLMFATSLVSRFMAKPTEFHHQIIKKIFRYLNGSVNLGILYKRRGGKELQDFTDNDYANDTTDRKSIGGYVLLMNEGAVAWSSKKQPIVTLSTIEAEFVTAASCACQAVWM
ncbi:LOW QUALITY PROTEIN: hypothetical protein V2J09_000644 [Rumex salicifolius]